jgi:hypothetical protein
VWHTCQRARNVRTDRSQSSPDPNRDPSPSVSSNPPRLSGLPREPGLFRLGNNLVDLPLFLEYDRTEKSERADRDFERTGRELSFAGQVQLVGANLVGTLGRRGAMKVPGERWDALRVCALRV